MKTIFTLPSHFFDRRRCPENFESERAKVTANYTWGACPAQENGAVFGRVSFQEALQGTNETHGPQVPRQKLDKE